MRYFLGIYGDENEGAQMTPEQGESEMKAYYDFGQEAEAAGVLVAGDALHPTSSATTIRVQDGETLTTDGPFAETKEQLGGYYIVNCKDLDEATLWASKIPGAKRGAIEIRPLMEFDEQE